MARRKQKRNPLNPSTEEEEDAYMRIDKKLRQSRANEEQITATGRAPKKKPESENNQ